MTLPTAIHVAVPSYGETTVETGALGELLEAGIAGDLTATVAFSLPVPVPPRRLVPDDLGVHGWVTTEGGQALWAKAPGAQLLVRVATRRTHVRISADTDEALTRLWEQVSALAEAAIADGTDQMPLTLWSFGSSAVKEQDLVTPLPWASARRNYPEATAAALDPVMALEGPPARGRLLLWHGAPGTGKTSALTALMTQWLPWCDPHLVTDPEQLFAAPQYLMQVFNSRGTTALGGPLPGPDTAPDQRWKLVVCEDADEYLRADGQARSGPALGRLLNATDGLLGRNLRTLVLLTTNDDVNQLHRALTRPGRCASLVEFRSFSDREARQWLPDDLAAPAGGATLAELYGLVDGFSDVQPSAASPGLYL